MHLTDDQLNEYLDKESIVCAQIKAHLSSCDECAARFTALKTLFAEIESLPEMDLTHSIAARFTPTPSLPPHLPRWLTLTATLQAVVAVMVLVVAAPFVIRFLPVISTPSVADLILQIQPQWLAFLDLLSSFHFPTLSTLPTLELSNLAMMLTLLGSSLLWLVGNGLLLRNQR